MNLTIHRGTHEIGGTCIELSSGSTRILLDIGRPLPPRDLVEAKKTVHDADLLPKISGLYHGETEDAPISGIVISHAHQDHYGLISHVKPEVPVYAGVPTAKLMELSTMFGPPAHTLLASRFSAYRDGKKFKIGNFTITPFCMDHSAFDAHAFLIEAGGKSLFYSGDFRAHGRKKNLFGKFLRIGPENVDALLLEGTMLSRPDALVESEANVERRIMKICQDHQDGIVLAYLSSQNIDRITSFYRAAIQSKRILAVDLYTAWVLSEVKGKTGIPAPSKAFKDLEVFYPFRLTRLIMDKMGRKDIGYRFKNYRLSRENINANPSRYILMVRPTMMDDLDRMTCLNGGVLAYSLWDGYKKDEKTGNFLDRLNGKGMTTVDVHTSGHAPLAVLKNIADKLKPGMVIPIHTEHAGVYQNHFNNVKRLKDGQTFTI